MTTSVLQANKPSQNIHVFMVSFPGQGHVNPLLRLGKRLAHFGLLVTFCAPEAVGSNIRKSNNITDDEPTPFGRGMIRFEFFDDGPGKEEDLELYMSQLEVAGREKLPEIIKKQEEKARPVSCLIVNPFMPWVSDVAENLGIPSAILWVQSCACFSAYYHYYNKLVPFPTEKEQEIDVQLPCMPLLKHDEIPSFLHPSSQYSFIGKAILGQFRNLSKYFCVLMDTYEELEREIIEYMSKNCMPVKTIGPLFKEFKSTDNATESTTTTTTTIRADIFAAENCMDWLDSKPERTVVYVSFGSVVKLKKEQLDEIAHGLLSSEVTFLWVLRGSNEEQYVLPEGFMEKVGDRGKIVKWSPQEEVLAHQSVACFVTHCGWNSSVEAMTSGVPVVAFPQWGDQVTNAKFLVDVYKVGVRMCRGEAEGRIVLRDEVERCLKAATTGSLAEEMKENALKWKKAAKEAVAEGGSSYNNMQNFVDEVVRLVGK